jgi:hypothetical protein
VGDWTIPRSVEKEYIRQITAEKRIQTTDIKGRSKYEWIPVRKDNHLLDCELMIIVASLANKILTQVELET